MLETMDITLNTDPDGFTSTITHTDLSSNSLLHSIGIYGSLITDLDFSNNINGLEL